MSLVLGSLLNLLLLPCLLVLLDPDPSLFLFEMRYVSVSLQVRLTGMDSSFLAARHTYSFSLEGWGQGRSCSSMPGTAPTLSSETIF